MSVTTPGGQAAIRNALADLIDGVGGIHLHWPNVPEAPAGDGVHGDVHFLFSDPSAVTLGRAGEDEHIGLVQITLHIPKGSGEAAIWAAADTIRALCQSGTVTTHDGQPVTITGCGIGPFFVEGARFGAPVSIKFRARTHRSL